MNELKSTPGPWHAVGMEIRGENLPAAIASVNRMNYADGDASLIAAAPELYEALEIAIKDGASGYLEWVETAKAALEKARGES